MKVSIFGLGYVGCVSLGCLAQMGNQVTGIDINEKKMRFIENGRATVTEKDIDKIIDEAHQRGKIFSSSSAADAVKETEISFICVGTPSTNKGHLDLNAVYGVSEHIADGIREKKGFHVIVIRSTVLPGTHHKIAKLIQHKTGKICNKDFSVVSNPEFLREGTAVHDFFNPPFTVIGTDSQEAIEKLKKIYSGIEAPFLVTDITVAEMIKFANNAFHALKITFANEIGNICKKLGVNSHQLMKIFCMDKKLNLSDCYLKPGFAYGGSCLPKDLRALMTLAHDHYLDSPVLNNIEKSNKNQQNIVFQKIIESNKQKIGFLGISFKSGTDDLRESPIIDIIERLIGKGYHTIIYDENVHISKLFGANRDYILKKIPFISKFITNDAEEFIHKSEVIVIVNNDRSFRAILDNVPPQVAIYDLVNYPFNKCDDVCYEGICW
jgi:GDP-mannose 6-dehydrogenase